MYVISSINLETTEFNTRIIKERSIQELLDEISSYISYNINKNLSNLGPEILATGEYTLDANHSLKITKEDSSIKVILVSVGYILWFFRYEDPLVVFSLQDTCDYDYTEDFI